MNFTKSQIKEVTGVLKGFMGRGVDSGRKLAGFLKQRYGSDVEARALVPAFLSSVITELFVNHKPELGFYSFQRYSAKEFPTAQRTKKPGPGSAKGERSRSRSIVSEYDDKKTQLKIRSYKFSITGFLKTVTERFGSDMGVSNFAIDDQVTRDAMEFGADETNFALKYGSAIANPYDYDGVLNVIEDSNRIQLFTAGVPQAPTTIEFLDDILSKAEKKNGKMLMIECSHQMARVLGRLENITKKLDVTRLDPQKRIEVPGGYVMTSYDGYPIAKTSLSGGEDAGDMSSVALSSTSTGGFLPDGSYNVQVSYLGYPGGESMASSVSNIVLAAGNATQKITCTFAPPEIDGVAQAHYYRVYVENTGNVYDRTLKDIVRAFTYTDGEQTGEITNFDILTLTVLQTDAAWNSRNDLPLTSVGGINSEIIQIIDYDAAGQGLGRVVYSNNTGSMVDGLWELRPTSTDDDFEQWLAKSYHALSPEYVKSSFVIRGVLPVVGT